MGLIKNILGSVFGLVASVVKGILGLVGIGKKSEYFMELDESSAPAPEPTPAAAAPDPAEKKAAAPAQASSQPKQAPAPAPKPEAAPVPTTSMPEAALPVAAAKVAPKYEGTFATDYLVNPQLSTGGRRRPGPSLSPFKDMARQVGTPAS